MEKGEDRLRRGLLLQFMNLTVSQPQMPKMGILIKDTAEYIIGLHHQQPRNGLNGKALARCYQQAIQARQILKNSDQEDEEDAEDESRDEEDAPSPPSIFWRIVPLSVPAPPDDKVSAGNRRQKHAAHLSYT